MIPNLDDAFAQGRRVGSSRLMLMGEAEPGLSPDELTVGRAVTISVNKSSGDGSWTDAVWRVVGVSGPNILMQCIDNSRAFVGNRPVMIRRYEHEIYDATEMAKAFAPSQDDTA